MSVIDRVESAKHTIGGSPIGKAATKATSREIIGPKKKHVDYLLQALNFDNVNIPQLADMLFERCQNSSWVVTFKALITFHHLMSAGNERFIQYVASRSTTWTLHNFLDKSGVQGYDMSHAVRRYSHYLAGKANAYRNMGFDFCRIPRGKDNGLVRNMDTIKLLKALPIVQVQLDALLSTEISSNDVTNGVITASFMLLFKDLIRLFACYNDGIINLLEKYFEMKKSECRTALEVYKKFVNRMDTVSAFLKNAEDIGIDKGDIPDLTQAPSSLLEALENHVQSLEKGKASIPPSKVANLPAFNVTSQMGKSADPFGVGSFDTPDGRSPSKDQITALEQERKALEAIQKNRQSYKENTSHSGTPPVLAAPVSQPRVPKQQLLLHQAAEAPKTNTVSNDLLQLDQGFTRSGSGNLPRSSTFPLADPNTTDVWNSQGNSWGQTNTVTAPASTDLFASTNTNNMNFEPAFQNNQNNSGLFMGELLQPTLIGGEFAALPQSTERNDGSPGDVSSSMARIAKSLDDLSINTSMQKVATQKGQHQWKTPPPHVKTGGANFQNFAPSKSSLPPAAYPQSPPNWGASPPMNSVGMAGPRPPIVSYPGQPPMGMYPTYSPPAMMPMYSQRMPLTGSQQMTTRPLQDPFGPVPSSQVRF